MKAGSGSGDQARRLVESNEILDDAASLPVARHLILGGDFNTQSSNQPGFRALVGNTYNTGVFVDPITVPGSWNNSSAFRMIHTQDPATQVDDRYDLLLLSQSLVDGTGAEYIGDFDTPWDLSRWDDPNHSHRCWGNDGSSYNTVLRTTGNENCGPVIAQALIALSSGLGHLPVYLDIAVPAKIGTNTAAIDLGDVPADSPFDFTLDAGSGGDVSLWGESGIEASDFSFFPGPGITSPVGAFTDAPGGTLITFDFTLDPAAVPAGAFNTYIDIASNDPDEPLLRIPVAGNRAIGGCNIADIAAELGVLNVNDIVEFVNAFNAADTRADISPLGGDGVLNVNDIVDFVNAFNAGCP
jgi:hypothetical protein